MFTYSDNAYFRHMFNLSRRSYFRKLIFKAYILSHTDKLFYPLVLVPIYLCIGRWNTALIIKYYLKRTIWPFTDSPGPWFIGHFVANKIGVSFMWGTYIEGYLLPVSFTFIFSSIFVSLPKWFYYIGIFTFVLPLFSYLSFIFP